jgi:hypothetical protein
MIEPSDPFEAGLNLAAAFEDHGVSYALGGALAFGLWGIPRATIDVDVNVFVTSQELGPVFAALQSLRIAFEEQAAMRSSERDGMFSARFGSYRVDVFTASIAFSYEAERTRVQRRVEGRPVWFLSAEALAVFKLLFFRPKDLVDLQRLLAVQGPALDTAYIRRHLVEMMGEDDERTRRWDELVDENTRF